MKSISLNTYIYSALIIFVLTALAYSNIYHDSYILDDYIYIIDNDKLIEQSYISFFVNDFAGYYRPIATIAFKFANSLFGYNAYLYHALNFSLFYITCYLFYVIFSYLSLDRKLVLLAVSIWLL